HTVMSDLCTGCNLCVDPCPTHCIELRPVNETPDSWKWDLNTIPVRIIPVEQHA
ncbi:TPA: 4Fe-4S binding protein, partial [Salmonella enterica]|nr:4Fe-4S binding protein [Salmonella enterica]